MIRPLSNLLRRLTRTVPAPSLEIHVPILPTPTFFHMLRCLTLSLRHFGGLYRDAPIIVTAGDPQPDFALAERLPWLAPSGVELRWLPAELWQRYGIFALGVERFHYDFRADVVLFLDADVLVAAPFEVLIQRVHNRRTFAGVLGYVSPFEYLGRGLSWQQLYDHIGLGQARLEHEHIGWGTLSDDPAYRRCPPYFNLGVLCARRDVMSQIGRTIYAELDGVNRFVETHFRCQLALTLALARVGIPCDCLPLRYNCANHAPIEQRFPREVAEARFLHLNGPMPVPKDDLFRDPESIATFVRMPGLKGVARKAQEVLTVVAPALCDSETYRPIEVA
jgi:hypothetical protein